GGAGPRVTAAPPQKGRKVAASRPGTYPPAPRAPRSFPPGIGTGYLPPRRRVHWQGRGRPGPAARTWWATLSTVGDGGAVAALEIAGKPHTAPEPPSVTDRVRNRTEAGGGSPLDGGHRAPGAVGPAAVRVLFAAAPGSRGTLGLDAATAAGLGVGAGQTVRLRAGRREAVLTVRVEDGRRPGRAALAPETLATLGIPPGAAL